MCKLLHFPLTSKIMTDKIFLANINKVSKFNNDKLHTHSNVFNNIVLKRNNPLLILVQFLPRIIAELSPIVYGCHF